jgi:hypothetical protein
VQEHDRCALSLLAHEAGRAPGHEFPAGGAVDVDRVASVLAGAHRFGFPFGIGAILSNPGLTPH